ncbi:hypothetical protein Tco_0414807 [Tanacetum coccineum]
MRILSVISVKVFEKYGYNYLREIILCRADYKEYKILEKDFKNLHPMIFKDLYPVRTQIFKKSLTICPRQTRLVFTRQSTWWIRKPGNQESCGRLAARIEKLTNKDQNLNVRNGMPTDYYFKEDYTIVPKPRAIIYRDRNDQRKLMRLNDRHKFSRIGIGQRITRIEAKYFITAIEKRLQIRRIFRSLESFVGGRIKDIDYRLINRTTETTSCRNNKNGQYFSIVDTISCTYYERPHKGVKAFTNSDIVYFFTSAQDGDPLQDDVRLCVGDDLKKA